mmetsp:Transcript_42066/g.95860  ORF Transcript_42066/g.95860 Transcript_42066/m.95860 type:complete len:286 (+) Transcript_42066:28-885(+)
MFPGGTSSLVSTNVGDASERLAWGEDNAGGVANGPRSKKRSANPVDFLRHAEKSPSSPASGANARTASKLKELSASTGLSLEQVTRVAEHLVDDNGFPELDDKAFIESLSLLRSLSFTHRNAIPISDLRKWTTIGFMLGWERAADKLSNEAATMALVSTLTLSLLFPVFIEWPDFSEAYHPAVSDHIDVANLEIMYGAFVWFSIMFAVMSVVFAVVIISQLNLCCTDMDFALFIRNFEWVEGVSFLGFLGTMLCMAGAAWTVLAVKCPDPIRERVKFEIKWPINP